MNDSAHPHTTAVSVKETLEPIVIAFVLAFVLRAFVVEAFVIPTGSMAPTLLGKHLEITCPQCGYRFPVNWRDKHASNPREPSRMQGTSRYPIVVRCPMDGYEIERGIRPIDGGDRILVLKYIYALSEPRRWDVAVFKNPKNPKDNYIKRVVGLPGEQLRIARGDVYTRADATESWEVARKPERAQRAMWQPVYRSRYFPIDDGDDRNLDQPWRSPWAPQGATSAYWSPIVNGRVFGRSFAYRDDQDRPGTLQFEYWDPTRNPGRRNHRTFAANTADDRYPYNQIVQNWRSGMGGPEIVQDVRVSATITPAAEGLGVTFGTTTDQRQVRGTIDPDGRAFLQSRPADSNREVDWQTVATTQVAPLAVGRGTRIELWCVDHSVSLWVGGEMIAKWLMPNNIDPASLGPARTLPRITITVAGAPARMHSVDVDRDVYYTTVNPPSGVQRAIADTLQIRDDEFFCLGDNSPASEDGRLWDMVDPWVQDDLGGRPGVVPRDLMVGKAFFVYFPAGFRVPGCRWALVPNFADMRFIH